MTLTPGFQDSMVAACITTMSEHGPKFRLLHGSGAPTSTAWPAANRAYFVPFRLAAPVTAVEMFFITGTGPGTANFDLGIYRDDFTLLVSLGATACVNTTDAVMPVGGGNIADTELVPGRYYLAMSAAATTITSRAKVNANGFMAALGIMMQETAHPLPATATPVSAKASAFIPNVGVATITNVL